MSSDLRVSGERSDDGFVPFLRAGEDVKGEFHCSECGYGVTVYRRLPLCPMCGGSTWEQTAWSPFARTALAAERHSPTRL